MATLEAILAGERDAHQRAPGARYRRLHSRLGTRKALTAIAHALARIIWV